MAIVFLRKFAFKMLIWVLLLIYVSGAKKYSVPSFLLRTSYCGPPSRRHRSYSTMPWHDVAARSSCRDIVPRHRAMTSCHDIGSFFLSMSLSSKVCCSKKYFFASEKYCPRVGFRHHSCSEMERLRRDESESAPRLIRFLTVYDIRLFQIYIMLIYIYTYIYI